MAKKQKRITFCSIPMMNLLYGKDILTAYDAKKGRFEGLNGDHVKDVHKDAMKKMKEMMIPHIMDKYAQLVREHTQKMIDIGYGMKRSQFKKLDQINLSDLLTKKVDDNEITMPSFKVMEQKEYKNYISNTALPNTSETASLDNLLCMMVPPFTEFGICLSKSRYLYMKVSEIDMISHIMNISVQDYTIATDTFPWIPGSKCDARISVYKTIGSQFDLKSYMLDISCTNAFDPYDINIMIPYKDLRWNETQIQMWEKANAAYTKPAMDALAEIGRSSYIELVKYALLCCIVTNYMLYGNRPVIKREPKESEKRASENSKPINSQNKTLPERRTRTIGLISIKSTAVPKRATPDTVRKWKVAVWKARGGIRHMQDGRIIPFKECIKHRKALVNQETENAIPVTIKMKDNRPDSDSQE